jgi:hypothetical protein
MGMLLLPSGSNSLRLNNSRDLLFKAVYMLTLQILDQGDD